MLNRNLIVKSLYICMPLLVCREQFKELDGVFAFVLYDRQQEVLHIGRDPIGVRPCFWGIDKDRALYVASEAKALDSFVERVNPFVPGMSMTWCLEKREIRQSTVIYPYNYLEIGPVTEDFLLDQIRYRLSDAVKKRMMSHREIGCLLSGGLDSSLIAALVSSFSDKPIQTFSIGLKDSVDLHYARMVADHIGSIHHEVELTEDAFLQAIPEVIYNIESYDTTTVRASVGNYLVSKYISENTDCKVIFNGDGSDEVCVGYFYNINAPDLKALQQESVRLVREYIILMFCVQTEVFHLMDLRQELPFGSTIRQFLHGNSTRIQSI